MEQLSGLDSAFLYLETPDQPMHVVLCAVLDPTDAPEPLTFERFRDHVRSRLADLPLMTRRLVKVPLDLHRPFWAHDPVVDLDAHVRHVTLPSPGGQVELEALCARLAGIPLDRERPLWELWHADGLAGGRVATIAKVHHSVLDGIAGVVQLVALFDLEAPEPGAAAAPIPLPDLAPAEELPSRLELTAWSAVDRARDTVRAIPSLTRAARNLAAIGSSRLRSDSTAGATPMRAPSSPFNGSVSGGRTVNFGRISLEDVGKIRKAVAGATVNDVVLATCAGALRQYLLAKGEPVDRPLMAVVPVNVRRDEQRHHTDNRVSLMFVTLPVHEADPLTRLQQSHASAGGAKDEHDLFGPHLLGDLANIADVNSLRVFAGVYGRSRLADVHPPPVNCVISNVPGPPFPLYMAGAKLEHVYPMGQVAESVGLNITVMSYCDAIDIGLMAATRLVPDLADLRDAVETAFDELRVAAI